MSHDHKIIQNFKRESKKTTYKVLCPFWGKIPHFDYHHRDEFFSLRIVKMGYFTLEWDQNLVCYVMIRIHAYVESVEPPTMGTKKYIYIYFHYD